MANRKARLEKLEKSVQKTNAPTLTEYTAISDEEAEAFYLQFIEEIKNTPPDPAFEGMTSDEAINYYFKCIQ